MRGGDYLAQRIWSMAANGTCAAISVGRRPNGVRDELLPIARIGAVTKENYWKRDFTGQD